MTDNRSDQDMLKKYPNHFLLSVAISKRARQLKDGARPLIDINPEEMHPILTALEELKQGKLHISLLDEIEEDAEFLEEISQSLDDDINQDSSKEETMEKMKKKDLSIKNKSKSLGA